MFHWEDLKAFYPYQLSINQSALRPRRSGDVFLFIYIIPGQCPSAPPSSPSAARQPPSDSGEGWRVETSHYQQQPGTQSIAMSTTRKLVLSLPR